MSDSGDHGTARLMDGQPVRPSVAVVDVKTQLLDTSKAVPHELVCSKLQDLFAGYVVNSRVTPLSHAATERLAIPLDRRVATVDTKTTRAAGVVLGTVGVVGGLIRFASVAGSLSYPEAHHRTSWADRLGRPGTVDLESDQCKKPEVMDATAQGLFQRSADQEGRGVFGSLIGELDSEARSMALTTGKRPQAVRGVQPERLRMVVLSGEGLRRSLALKGLAEGWAETTIESDWSKVLVTTNSAGPKLRDVIELAEWLAVEILVAKALEVVASLFETGKLSSLGLEDGLVQYLASDAFVGPRARAGSQANGLSWVRDELLRETMLGERICRSWRKLKLFVGPM